MGAAASIGAFNKGMSSDDLESLLVSKFKEFDVDNTGYILIADVTGVIDWILNGYTENISSDSLQDVRVIIISKILMKDTVRLTL